MSERVDVRTVASALHSRRWLITLLILVGAVGGFAAEGVVRPVYQATTSVHVGQPLEAADLDEDGLKTSEEIAGTYSDIIRRELVLQRVVDTLGLHTTWQQLSSRVGVGIPPKNRQLLVIIVQGSSPDEARTIAAEIANQLIALSPSSEGQAATEVRSFIMSRLGALQDDIERAQSGIDGLEGSLATANDEAATNIERRLIVQRRRLISLEGHYSSLLESLSTEPPSNVVQVLETAEARRAPVWPNLPLFVTAGASMGLLAGCCIAYALRFKREGRMGLRLPRVTPAPGPD